VILVRRCPFTSVSPDPSDLLLSRRIPLWIPFNQQSKRQVFDRKSGSVSGGFKHATNRADSISALKALTGLRILKRLVGSSFYDSKSLNLMNLINCFISATRSSKNTASLLYIQHFPGPPGILREKAPPRKC